MLILNMYFYFFFCFISKSMKIRLSEQILSQNETKAHKNYFADFNCFKVSNGFSDENTDAPATIASTPA